MNFPQISFPLKTIKENCLLFKERKKIRNLWKVLQQFEMENLTSATPRICGNVYDEQPAGVSRIVAYGVWNQAFSLAQTISHSGKIEAPNPRAGPLIATTIGFLNWIKAFTKSLK